MRWYVNNNGNTVGPLSEERITMLCRWGKVSRGAYICDEQFSNWVSISRTPFAEFIAGESAVADESAAEGQPESSAGAPPPTRQMVQAGQSIRTYLVGMALLAGAVLLAVTVGP
jgi:hypothetical protein